MNEDVLKLIATLQNAGIAFESIRLKSGQKSKDLEYLKNEIIQKTIEGKPISENIELINNTISAHIIDFSRAVKSLIESLNGDFKPGIIPQNIQLDLFLDVPASTDSEDVVFEPSKRVMHRSGIFQPPLSLSESRIATA